jgi:3-deoxy-D-manno-octulosonic acid kinase
MPRARAAVRATSARQLRELLQQNSTLYQAVRGLPNAQPVSGRGTAYAVRLGEEGWLVRHYRRGGAVARYLDDRYARWAPSRAMQELRASAQARAAGMATPEVVAAVEYDAGVFRRFDIAVELIPGARDLSDALFSDSALHSAHLAAAAIGTMLHARFMHADLNLKNILVTDSFAWIVDLDRGRLVDGAMQGHAAAMRARLVRSLEKWQLLQGRAVAAEVRSVLERAFDV